MTRPHQPGQAVFRSICLKTLTVNRSRLFQLRFVLLSSSAIPPSGPELNADVKSIFTVCAGLNAARAG